jgi:hypothetical protein
MLYAKNIHSNTGIFQANLRRIRTLLIKLFYIHARFLYIFCIFIQFKRIYMAIFGIQSESDA